MTTLPIGLQLFSVRDDCARDLPGVLKAVADMGYVGVEFAGYYGHTASELRTLLDDNGLRCCGTHTALDTILGDELPQTIEFNRALGNEFLIVPWLPEERRASRAAWLETARLFDDAAQRAAVEGMRVGYHNHTEEFYPLDGELPWDLFFGHTRPEVVMQVDTGNMRHGGADPAPFLERYPGRALTVHLKEYSATDPDALIGDGDINWEQIFALCEGVGGTQWYVVEQESGVYPPMDCVARCLQNLRRMGK